MVHLGLLQSDWDWWVVLRAAIMSALIIAMSIGAIYRLRPTTLLNYQELAALAAIVVIWLLAAKFMIIPHDWVPYLYPLAAMSMLITVLIDLRVAVVLVIALALTVHYLSENNSMLVAYVTLGALSGALMLGRAERLSAFLWAGLSVALSNLLTYIAFRTVVVDFSASSLSHNAPLYFSILLNGGLSASVALIGYFVLGNLFNLTTSLQLSELSRPAHPLLRQLLLKAPGTYHHTIVVSNLAERAAAAIGIDALLVRVGAYYHDIGKTVRPYFFTENILEGNSPHEKLDPTTSAQIIISHVTDGMDLAQKYRLPPRIRDFIWEHHGNSLMQYFYRQAQRDAEEGEAINPEDFRYPGPYPRSKETAILLLADTCEAAVRSVRPATREELEKLVNKLIDDRVTEGALNYCDLTFKDLQTVRKVFIQVLQGVHHPRISYPDPVQRPEQPTVSSNEHAPPSVKTPQPNAAPSEIPGAEEEAVTVS
ncbi:MAG: HDIG domain-containing protein [Caldilineaceae bacterium]